MTLERSPIRHDKRDRSHISLLPHLIKAGIVHSISRQTRGVQVKL